MHKRISIAFFLLLLLFAIAACKADDATSSDIAEKPAPTLHPTFTPTQTKPPVPPTATPTPTPAATPAPELPTATPTPETPKLKIVIEKISIRQGPGTLYFGAGVAKKDQVFNVIARNEKGTWVQVKLEEDKTGWLPTAEKYAQVTGDLSGVAVAENVPPPPARVHVTADKVNLRSGPGTNYPTAGQAKKGQAFLIAAKNKDGSWFQIKLKGGKTAWVINDKKWTKTSGGVGKVAVATDIPTPPPTPKPKPTAKPAPTATPAPTYLFAKLQMDERINTNNYVTFYAGLFTSNLDGAVGGYKLIVVAPTGAQGEAVFGNVFLRGDPGLDSEFIYNAKVEFMGGPAGSYNVFVADGGGNQVSEIWVATVNGDTRTFLPRWKQK